MVVKFKEIGEFDGNIDMNKSILNLQNLILNNASLKMYEIPTIINSFVSYVKNIKYQGNNVNIPNIFFYFSKNLDCYGCSTQNKISVLESIKDSECKFQFIFTIFHELGHCYKYYLDMANKSSKLSIKPEPMFTFCEFAFAERVADKLSDAKKKEFKKMYNYIYNQDENEVFANLFAFFANDKIIQKIDKSKLSDKQNKTLSKYVETFENEVLLNKKNEELEMLSKNIDKKYLKNIIKEQDRCFFAYKYLTFKIESIKEQSKVLDNYKDYNEAEEALNNVKREIIGSLYFNYDNELANTFANSLIAHLDESNIRDTRNLSFFNSLLTNTKFIPSFKQVDMIANYCGDDKNKERGRAEFLKCFDVYNADYMSKRFDKVFSTQSKTNK